MSGTAILFLAIDMHQSYLVENTVIGSARAELKPGMLATTNITISRVYSSEYWQLMSLILKYCQKNEESGQSGVEMIK